MISHMLILQVVDTTKADGYRYTEMAPSNPSSIVIDKIVLKCTFSGQPKTELARTLYSWKVFTNTKVPS